VRNRIIPGTIEIEKSATPQGSRAFAFTGSLGPFALVDDGAGDRAARTFTGLVPGTYTVRELVPDGWELTGVACIPAAAAAISGPEAIIALAPGGSVVCTYRDLRIDPPVPPTPPTPPEPPPPGPPAPPVTPAAPEPPPSTHLRVVKTAPRVARIGDRLPFRLVVTNRGSVAARHVLVADVPPAAVRLASLRARGAGKVHRVRGHAIWRVGTLRPGETRTIRGSVQVKAGTPGLKRNLVLAGAVNAQLARDVTDTLVLAQRRIIPAVTG
jgi:uncharacterized repeat protein (TIGR01451 family)